MRHLSDSAARVAGKCFQRKYIALGRIVNHWHDIVGESLADKATPVKIHYRKKIKDKPAEAKLDIAVSSAHATALHYQKDLILEKINNIFGERWVTAIRFVDTPANTQSFKPKRIKKPLTSVEKKTLSDMLVGVEDGDIQKRLQSLGESLLMDQKS